eukprot:CAMPEP_0116035010 /NCGR_PEP_ID=MMETSP0321-20121206/20043_1 /TAXON_ID=163516 /ORGANISM="Leptocylindrus danicus var. danicus, Strain B650" /LENGTH=474 /DNA_ID=CAMNT_0003511621 /DNA_START=97 /DNA_END=1521 /DNA_ORIENTATION=-
MTKMCLFYPNPSGHARSDPILSTVCAADHVHTFYGPQNFHPNTTNEQLRNTNPQYSTSPFIENQSLYWHPSIYQVTEDANGQIVHTRVNDLDSSPYYRWNKNTLPETVEFPQGFRMIAYSNSPGAVTGGEAGENLLVECCDFLPNGEEDCTSTTGNPLIFPTKTCGFLGIAFAMPTCWDESKGIGTNDPFSHVAYTTDGSVTGPCPAGFNKRIPQIQLFVRITNYKGGKYQLSDGSDVFHVDFMNGWQENTLQNVIDNCELTGVPGYNPPCDCTQFLTENTNTAPAVCDSDVKQYIVNEETEVVNVLPRGTCIGADLIEKSWTQDPPFAATDCNGNNPPSPGPPGNDDENDDETDDGETDDGENDDGEGAEECADSMLEFKAGKKLRLCQDWVAAKPGQRCQKPGVSEHCPVTCEAPDMCEENSRRKFVPEEVGKLRSCTWVAKNVSERCGLIDMCNTCRETCLGHEECTNFEE